MSRSLLPAAAWSADPVDLTGDEARHLAQVLRVRPGESITVFDGCGRRAAATVMAVTRERVTLELGDAQQCPPPRPAITLAQAIPKGKTMDLIVQKAVELGVAAIHPLVTRHTIVHPGEHKSDKWRRCALEACKQCGQDTLPDVADAMPFDPWLTNNRSDDGGLRLIASLAPGALPLREVLHGCPCAPDRVTVLVGPEGDFSPAETSAALAAGFQPVSLGSLVLRVETAALFAVSAIRYEFG